MKQLTKGILIVLEGIDGSGKSTQALALLGVLQENGYPAVSFREPSDSRWGRIIREKAAQPDSLTPEEELGLFLKDRRENVELNLKPALSGRNVVVLDRYYFSTMAYQGAKGLDPQRIREENESFAVLPDLVLILDVDAGKGLERISERGQPDLLFEREDYLVKVREIFQSLRGDMFFLLDARRPPEDVAEDVKSIVFDYLDFFVSEE
jgi:dTMP kinase